MAITDNEPLLTGDFRPWPRTAVFTAESCAGPWAEAPYLQVLEITEAAGPSIGRCRLRHDSGAIKREDQASFQIYDPLDLVGKFVRVELYHFSATAGQIGEIANGDYTALRYAWRFVIASDSIEPHTQARSSDASGDPRPNARGYAIQMITGYSLLHLLDRVPVQGGYALSPNGELAMKIDTPMTFNRRARRGFTTFGNRSAEKATLQTASTTGSEDPVAYVFDRTAEKWSIRDIAEYAMTFFAAELCPKFVLSGAANLLEGFTPVVDAEGKTVLQLLQSIISPRRGFSWREKCERDRDSAVVTMEIFAVTDQDIAAGGGLIAANPEQGTFELASRHDVAGVEIINDDAQRYGKIRVQGEPIYSVFSLSHEDGTLVAGWSSDEQAEYKHGAGLTTPNGAARNDAVRAHDRFSLVYSYFRPPRNWNWQVRNGRNGTALHVVNPLIDHDGVADPNQQGAYRRWAYTFLRQLPIEKPGGMDNQHEPEFLEPLCLLQLPDDSWLRADRAGDDIYVEGANERRHEQCGMRVHDRDAGVILSFPTQHYLAGSTWTEAPPANPSRRKPPWLTWKKMIVTVAVACDQRLAVEREVPGNDPARVKVIDVKDARLVWVVSDAVMGLKDDGTPETWADIQGGSPSGDARIHRDDSELLREVAGLAEAWYGVQRGILRLTLRMIDVPVYSTGSGPATLEGGTPVGGFVTALTDGLGSRPVNCVVTSKRYDFERLATTIMTDFEELDFAGVVRGL